MLSSSLFSYSGNFCSISNLKLSSTFGRSFFIEVRSFNCFGGKVCVYTGKKYNRMPLRRRRRLLDYNLEKGTQLWERHSEPIIETEKFCVHRTDNWKDEKDYLLREIKKRIKDL